MPATNKPNVSKFCDQLNIQKKDRTKFQSDVLAFVRKGGGTHLEESNFDPQLLLEIAEQFITSKSGRHYFYTSPSGTWQQPYDTKKGAEILSELIEVWSTKRTSDPTYPGTKAPKPKKTSSVKKSKAKMNTSTPSNVTPSKRPPKESMSRGEAGPGPSSSSTQMAQPQIIHDGSEEELPDVWSLLDRGKQSSHRRQELNTATQTVPGKARSSDQTDPERSLEDGLDVVTTATPFATPRAGPLLTPPHSAVRAQAIEISDAAKVQEEHPTTSDTPASPIPTHTISSDVFQFGTQSDSVLSMQRSGFPSTPNHAKRPAPQFYDTDSATIHSCEGSPSKRVRLSALDPVIPQNETQPQRERSTTAEAYRFIADLSASHEALRPSIPELQIIPQPAEVSTTLEAEHPISAPANDLTTLLSFLEKVQKVTLANAQSSKLSNEKVEESKTRSKFLALLLADLRSGSELSLWP